MQWNETRLLPRRGGVWLRETTSSATRVTGVRRGLQYGEHERINSDLFGDRGYTPGMRLEDGEVSPFAIEDDAEEFDFGNDNSRDYSLDCQMSIQSSYTATLVVTVVHLQ